MLAAAERLDLPVGRELTLDLETTQLSPELPYRAMLQLLGRSPEFTAIFAFNDVSALGAMRAIQDYGLRCPEDISVLGIDDVSTSAYLTPRLSTVAQPLEDMGAAAAEQLIAKIQRPRAEHPPRVFFPMTLHVRESTGIAPADVRRVEEGNSAKPLRQVVFGKQSMAEPAQAS
jgi:DNA-binding LacI/PurR family transcriptional regulator